MASPRVKVSNVRVSSVPHCGHQRAMGGEGAEPAPPLPGEQGIARPKTHPAQESPAPPPRPSSCPQRTAACDHSPVVLRVAEP